jgi:hypothetical protein
MGVSRIMSSNELDRRRFHELSAAALSGLIAGSLVGCGNRGGQNAPVQATAAADKHLCRGLNDCAGKDVTGENACRGQGVCATIEHHTCSGKNECKGQGGCGTTAGINECKGKGGCSVPLMTPAWKEVRQRKEAAWTAAGIKFGSPPETADDS